MEQVSTSNATTFIESLYRRDDEYWDNSILGNVVNVSHRGFYYCSTKATEELRRDLHRENPQTVDSTGRAKGSCPHPKFSGDIVIKNLLFTHPVWSTIATSFNEGNIDIRDPLAIISQIRDSSVTKLQSIHAKYLAQQVLENDQIAIEVCFGINHYAEFMASAQQRGTIMCGSRIVEGTTLHIEKEGYPIISINQGSCDSFQLVLNEGITQHDDRIRLFLSTLQTADKQKKRKSGVSAHTVLKIIRELGIQECFKCIIIDEIKQGTRLHFANKVGYHQFQVALYAALLREKGVTTLPIQSRLLYVNSRGVDVVHIAERPLSQLITMETIDQVLAAERAAITLGKLMENEKVALLEGSSPEEVYRVAPLGGRLEIMRSMEGAINDLLDSYNEMIRVKVIYMLTHPLEYISEIQFHNGITLDALFINLQSLLSFLSPLLKENEVPDYALHYLKKIKETLTSTGINEPLLQFLNVMFREVKKIEDEYLQERESYAVSTEFTNEILDRVMQRDTHFIRLNELLEICGHKRGQEGRFIAWRFRDGTTAMPVFYRERLLLIVIPPPIKHKETARVIILTEERDRSQPIPELQAEGGEIPVMSAKHECVTQAEVKSALEKTFGKSNDLDFDRTPFVYRRLSRETVYLWNSVLSIVLKGNIVDEKTKSDTIERARAYIVDRGIPLHFAVGYEVCCTRSRGHDLSHASVRVEGHLETLWQREGGFNKEAILQLGLASNESSIWRRKFTVILDPGAVGIVLRDPFNPDAIVGHTFRLTPREEQRKKSSVHRMIVPTMLIQEGKLAKMLLGNIVKARNIIFTEGIFDSLTMKLLIDEFYHDPDNYCVIGNVGLKPKEMNTMLETIQRIWPEKRIIFGFDRDASVTDPETGLLAKIEYPFINFWDFVQDAFRQLPDIDVVKDVNDLWCRFLMDRYGITVDIAGVHMDVYQREILQQTMGRIFHEIETEP